MAHKGKAAVVAEVSGVTPAGARGSRYCHYEGLRECFRIGEEYEIVMAKGEELHLVNKPGCFALSVDHMESGFRLPLPEVAKGFWAQFSLTASPTGANVCFTKHRADRMQINLSKKDSNNKAVAVSSSKIEDIPSEDIEPIGRKVVASGHTEDVVLDEAPIQGEQSIEKEATEEVVVASGHTDVHLKEASVQEIEQATADHVDVPMKDTPAEREETHVELEEPIARGSKKGKEVASEVPLLADTPFQRQARQRFVINLKPVIERLDAQSEILTSYSYTFCASTIWSTTRRRIKAIRATRRRIRAIRVTRRRVRAIRATRRRVRAIKASGVYTDFDRGSNFSSRAPSSFTYSDTSPSFSTFILNSTPSSSTI
ncbi:hypothetical protein Taro_050270 [Colocasia esculenta]|uniref:Uncharacterized protein n=1 Tax=Colocasia esculenta TaxID=4460 RepID=A0A843XDE6_COLES|nr:hypothetical protein [Colocasia esculenta]